MAELADYSYAELKSFWNGRILGWEENQYDRLRTKALTYRMKTAAEYLRELPRDSRILDFACGSGRLFDQLAKSRFQNLTGIDFSTSAIEAAQRKVYSQSVRPQFKCGDERDIRNVEFDVLVALGAWDWLSSQSRELLLQSLKEKRFLISFSNGNRKIQRRILETIYFFRRLFGFGALRPKFDNPNELLKLFHSRGLRDARLFNDGFGLVAFIGNLAPDRKDQ